MLKEYTCIICPNGCDIRLEIQDVTILSVEGAACERGYEYVKQELSNPHRNIASSIVLQGGVLPLVSVRLSNSIPKGKVFDVMAVIKTAHLTAPVRAGQVAIANVLGLGVDVIVTKDVVAK
jgi:CxxC motif-containing protein